MKAPRSKPETKPAAPQLIGDGIDLWRIDLNPNQMAIDPLFALLSDDEKTRADRFHFSRDRERFVVARAALRKILGNYLSIEPESIGFRYNRFGKPSLAIGEGRIEFNVSHSRDMGLIAIASDREVGVDVEFVDYDFNVMRAAEGAFSKEDVSRLSLLPADLRTVAFYEFWTRKEACLKAVGDGWSGSPELRLSISAIIRHSEATFESVVDGKTAKWCLKSLEIGDGYKAAIVVNDRIPALRYWNFPNDSGFLQPLGADSRLFGIPRVFVNSARNPSVAQGVENQTLFAVC